MEAYNAEVTALIEADPRTCGIFAGDMFDDGWRERKCPPELINFVIRTFPPRTYGVPGQHDLPHHDLSAIWKSAYWTVKEAGKIHNLRAGLPVYPGTVPTYPSASSPLVLYGFPWGAPLKDYTDRRDPRNATRTVHVAVCHKHVWRKGDGDYRGADKNNMVSVTAKALTGYDVGVFGDNHAGFLSKSQKKGQPTILNCGTFMRRRVDEKNYVPQVGLIYSDGSVIRVPLKSAKADVVSAKAGKGLESVGIDPGEFSEALDSLADVVADFDLAVRKYAEKKGLKGSVVEMLVELLKRGADGVKK